MTLWESSWGLILWMSRNPVYKGNTKAAFGRPRLHREEVSGAQRGMRAEPPDGSPTQTLTDQEWLCGWVRNPDSSFLATPKGPNGVLHLPLTSGKGSSPGWLCGVGCATLIHLFWRHRKAGTGCCIPPAQSWCPRVVGCVPLIHLFLRHRRVPTGCCISPRKAERATRKVPPGGPPRAAKFPAGRPADVGCRKKDE